VIGDPGPFVAVSDHGTILRQSGIMIGKLGGNYLIGAKLQNMNDL
jgi:hypothetical protein